jgi:hypothetical protein
MHWLPKVLWLLVVLTSQAGIASETVPVISRANPYILSNNLYQQRSKGKSPGSYSIFKKNQFLFKLPENKFRAFRDSIAFKTRDTLFTKADGRVDIHPYSGSYMASSPVKKNSPPLVYTDKKGYVNLRLPNPKFYRYVIRFYEPTGKLAFEIQSPKEELLILEKSNFVHAGAFDYEVWQDGSLQEKGRIFLSR